MIAVTAPLKSELTPLLSIADQVRVEKKKGHKVHFGRLGEQEFLFVKTGHGKVLTAAKTQWLIDQFAIDGLIHIGSAGSLNPQLIVGSYVLPTSVIEHDYLEKFSGSNFSPPKFLIKGFLFDRLRAELETQNLNFSTGPLISGTEDIVAESRRTELHQKFRADAVDWESSASTQVAKLNEVPTAVLRVVSDSASKTTPEDYKTHQPDVCRDLAQVLLSTFS